MFPQSSKFWRASDSFFAKQSATQTYRRYGMTFSSDWAWRNWVAKSRKPDRKKRKMDYGTWQQSRAKTPFLKDFRAVNTSRSTLDSNREVAISMRMSGRSLDNLLDIAGSVGPIVTEQLDTALASIAFNAWRKWPINTKLSKALLSLEYEILPGNVLQGSVRSNAWYSFYIKSRQNGLAGKQPYRVLMFQPSDMKIRKAAEAIAQNIDQYVKGARR